jgi:CubicO group peptidase (beta-lactamase class C family)
LARARSRAAATARGAILVAGLFSNLLLKGLAHALIALGVGWAPRLLEVAHVLIAVFTVAIAIRILLPAARRARRRRAAERAFRAVGAAPSPAGVEEAAARGLSALLTDGLVAGACAAVVRGDDVTFHACGRRRDDSPDLPDPRTLFEVGSLTKVFTGLLLADMADRGEVRLDDPLGAHLPALGSQGTGAVTLLDLATHRSGLPRLPRGLMRDLLRDALLTGRPPADPYAGVDAERLEAEARRAPRHAPGERFAYSNFGFALLGLALARAAGRDYRDLVAERVCAPLGLHETGFEPGGEAAARRAEGHDRDGRSAPNWHTAALAPAGGLSSTADDLARFAQAQLRPESTPLARALAAAQDPRRPARGDDRIGLAWMVRERAGGRVVWHNGSTGGFGSYLGTDRDREIAAVLLASSAHVPLLDEVGFGLLAQAASL